MTNPDSVGNNYYGGGDGTGGNGYVWGGVEKLANNFNAAPQYTVPEQLTGDGLRRQQDEIIAAFSHGFNGNPKLEFIGSNNPELDNSPRNRETVLTMIRDGRIGDQQVRYLIGSIKCPTNERNTATILEEWVNGLGSNDSRRHIQRVVSYAVFGERGFDDSRIYGGFNSGYIHSLISEYPLPQDFLARIKPLREHIEDNNSPLRHLQYESDIESLAEAIYGERYKYYRAYQELEKEALPQIGMDPRRQRKVIATLGYRDTKYLYWDDVDKRDLPEDAKEQVLGMFRQGFINYQRERDIVGAVNTPVKKWGAGQVFDGIQFLYNSDRKLHRHVMRVLGFATGGWEAWRKSPQSIGANSIEELCSTCPLPQDLFAKCEELICGLEDKENKRKEYSDAAAELSRLVYGERDKLLRAIRGLKSEAFKDADSGYPYSLKSERNSEWISGRCGIYGISREQSRSGFANGYNPEINPSSQDAALLRPDRQIYGVFDGAGGVSDGQIASVAARNSVDASCTRYLLEDAGNLGWALNLANQAVKEATKNGATTAALVKVMKDDNGTSRLAYAAMGDSRIYVVGRLGRVQLITRDENVLNQSGRGSVIYKYLGTPVSPGADVLEQCGEVNLQSGDRVVICSDGVTGDGEPDLMSPSMIGQIVNSSPDPQVAADRLVKGARKIDDRTAIVVAV